MEHTYATASDEGSDCSRGHFAMRDELLVAFQSFCQ